MYKARVWGPSSRPRSSALLLPALAAGLIGLCVGSLELSAADRLTPAATWWTVEPDFRKNAEGDRLENQARTNLSGAACAPTTPPFASCLIANDEKKYAQFFSIAGTTIVPGRLIRLMDKDVKGNPDAEAAAYADGYFYIAGSHGRSRSGKKNDPSYVVFRIPVDKQTGIPAFHVSEDEVVGVEASNRLREAIRNGETIGAFFDKPLAEGGVNIEGMAVRNGRIHFGLRGPSVKKEAFLLGVDAAALFTPGQDLRATVTPLRLGKNAGIRDLAAVDDGLLILSGPVNEQDVAAALFHFDDGTGRLQELGELVIPDKPRGAQKAETLLVLDDRPGQARRLLVMFDGPENGAPTEYVVRR